MFNKNNSKDKIIGAILAKVQAGPKEKEEKESSSPEGNDDLEVGAEEVLSAIKTRDVKALAESLKYFIDCVKELDE